VNDQLDVQPHVSKAGTITALTFRNLKQITIWRVILCRQKTIAQFPCNYSFLVIVATCTLCQLCLMPLDMTFVT